MDEVLVDQKNRCSRENQFQSSHNMKPNFFKIYLFNFWIIFCLQYSTFKWLVWPKPLHQYTFTEIMSCPSWLNLGGFIFPFDSF